MNTLSRSGIGETADQQCRVAVQHPGLYYGDFLAVRDTVHADPRAVRITAFIGPSGCGKSTVLRSLNRMNDLVRGFRVEGEIFYMGRNIYAPDIDPVGVRRYIGMVFQQPNPFAMSIYQQRCLRPADQPASRTTCAAASRKLCVARRCGTRSRTNSNRAVCRSPAASSNGCASPAPSPPSRMCC